MIVDFVNSCSTTSIWGTLSIMKVKFAVFHGSAASVDSKATAASKSSSEDQGSSADFSNDGDLTALHEVGIEILHFLLCHLLIQDNPYGLTDDSLVSFYELLRAGENFYSFYPLYALIHFTCLFHYYLSRPTDFTPHSTFGVGSRLSGAECIVEQFNKLG
ncbi:unnamed protein product [Dibothriocephalus latus]|uniref:Uncharacterized protein n=1 Tax=Dibothriocephalus latus TaxID=60516 RepID=A0A3P7PGN6_DIBLA|nr:unnamed protein product [Dibothriocephalus latus]